MSEIRLSDIIIPKFREFHTAYKSGQYTFFILKGGRNSAKSTHISFEIILDIIKNPVSFAIVKRYNNSITKTVLPQMKWGLEKLGVAGHFKENKKEQTLTYSARGNKIYFLGADEPERLKGLKDDKFPIVGLWIDELSQFRDEEDADKIKNSVIRDELPKGLSYKIIYSYNPPKRKHNWVNKRYESVTLPETYYVSRSSYLDNPYCAKEFILEAEYIREVNPRKYDHEYLGLPIGNGIVPFDNLEFRRITDAEIMNFDNIRQGLDWGYGIDPVHFSRMHYDKTRRKLYIFGEIHGAKIGNRALAEMIKAKGWNDILISADSAEPKSIDEMKEQGIRRIDGAEKPPGSVEYGEKWLDELEAIIIDHERCPNTAREFESIDYQTDRDGNPKNKLEDKDNHSIDSVRYALFRDMKSLIGSKYNAFGV